MSLPPWPRLGSWGPGPGPLGCGLRGGGCGPREGQVGPPHSCLGPAVWSGRKEAWEHPQDPLLRWGPSPPSPLPEPTCLRLTGMSTPTFRPPNPQPPHPGRKHTESPHHRPCLWTEVTLLVARHDRPLAGVRAVSGDTPTSWPVLGVEESSPKFMSTWNLRMRPYLERGSLQMGSVMMRSHWSTVSPNAMTGAPVRGTFRQKDTRDRPHRDRHRGWRDAATSPGMKSGAPKAGRGRKDPPPEPPEGAGPVTPGCPSYGTLLQLSQDTPVPTPTHTQACRQTPASVL